jgi:hypothetical protein
VTFSVQIWGSPSENHHISRTVFSMVTCRQW